MPALHLTIDPGFEQLWFKWPMELVAAHVAAPACSHDVLGGVLSSIALGDEVLCSALVAGQALSLDSVMEPEGFRVGIPHGSMAIEAEIVLTYLGGTPQAGELWHIALQNFG